MINILNKSVSKHSEAMVANKNRNIDEIILGIYGADGLKELSGAFDDYVKKHQEAIANGDIDDNKIRSYHK